jgi:hypothetical protein
MSEKEKILAALKRPGSLRFPCNEKSAADIESALLKAPGIN